MRIINIKALLIIFAMIFAACSTVPYTMKTPAHFKKYKSKREFKMITANGVKVKARQVDNYPKASLDFWKDATKEHLVKKGYSHQKTDCFKTAAGLKGCTIKFALPKGAEDWIYQETIFVVEEQLVLLEATGEFSRFAAVEKELNDALITFKPNL